MRAMKNAGLAFVLVLAASLPGACSTNSSKSSGSGGSGASTGTAGDGGGLDTCDNCLGNTYNPCDGPSEECAEQCSPGLGCTECVAGTTFCVGNDIHSCNDDGTPGSVVDTCDAAQGLLCSEGACKTRCEVAEDQPSNVGCEFWAVDLDQVDLFNDPASMPWGVALSNASDAEANITIEINEAAPGETPIIQVVEQLTVAPGALNQVVLPTREVDCGLMPNDYAAPGTCLSSRAFRITSSAPIVVYQFNVFENAFSNDASLLLPSNALGKVYRAINWSAGHPIDPFNMGILDRSYVTIVGVEEGTIVEVHPTWRVRGNGPIPATDPGGVIQVTLGPFDVLNLETDDAASLAEASMPGVADLTGTTIEASKPVAVFSGVESTSAPYHVDIPTYSGWNDESCCLDHLEEQLFPLEAIGTKFLITRSPVRSTGSYKEPDVLRFVGAAEVATVTTNLPAPLNSFTIAPGEIVDTWADTDIVVTATAPVLIGQLLVSQGYVEGALKGDPALTVLPPVEQYRSEYIILTPTSWIENWVVIAAEVTAEVTIDGAVPTSCILGDIVDLDGVDYQARRCPLAEGAHNLSGDSPFGIVAYGYGNAGSYAFAGGADVKAIYEPPPLR
jgi:IgGFc binding protein